MSCQPWSPNSSAPIRWERYPSNLTIQWPPRTPSIAARATSPSQSWTRAVRGLHAEAIASDDLILVTSERVPALEGPPTPDIISGLPFVSAQWGMPRREIEENLLERYGIRRRSIILEFGHAESLKQAVRAGAGYAFVFRSSLRGELQSNLLREVETPGMSLKVPVYLVRRPNKRLSSFQQRLVDFLVDEITAQLEGRPPAVGR